MMFWEVPGIQDFSFLGTLPASKSMLNRALIIQSFAPGLQIEGDSQCDDVVLMKAALAQFPSQNEFDCGSAGTVLRFLALRVSRRPGVYFLRGTPRLFSRPQKELEKLLLQLGCEVEFSESLLKIRSFGWALMGDGVHISSQESSQFLSAILLSAWNFEKDIFIHHRGKVSSAYLDLTLRLLRESGMNLKCSREEIAIFANQKVLSPSLKMELDMSSAFAIGCHAALGGAIRVLGFKQDSSQPDSRFSHTLKELGVPVNLEGEVLSVKGAQNLQAIQVDLSEAPDLFPCLAVLCAFAEGESILFGAPQLVFKESNRIQKVAELLGKMNRKTVQRPDGIHVFGHPRVDFQGFEFNPDEDHRLAMAASMAMRMVPEVKILNPEVVTKSFPEFWKILHFRSTP